MTTSPSSRGGLDWLKGNSTSISSDWFGNGRGMPRGPLRCEENLCGGCSVQESLSSRLWVSTGNSFPAHYIGMRNHAVPIATGPQGKQASGWSRQKTTHQKSRNNLSLLGSHCVAGATNLTACLTFGLVVK